MRRVRERVEQADGDGFDLLVEEAVDGPAGLSGIELAQVASAPAIGNLEAGIVASLTSLRVSIVSGGVACVLGTVALALVFPALVRYDARRSVPT